MKTIFNKMVSIISKINGSLLCKYASDVFMMSVEDNKTPKNYVTEKLHKAYHTPREAVQQPLKGKISPLHLEIYGSLLLLSLKIPSSRVNIFPCKVGTCLRTGYTATLKTGIHPM